MENDIDMGPPRGRSHINLSNSSRDSSIISTTSFKLYYKHIEIQNNNPSWFNQIEDEYNACSLDTNIGKSNISSSSVSGNNLKNKQWKINETLALNNTLPSSVESMVND